MIRPSKGPFTWGQLASCLEREIGQRYKVYSGLVARGKIPVDQAEFEIGMMERIHSIMLVIRDDDEIARLISARLDPLALKPMPAGGETDERELIR